MGTDDLFKKRRSDRKKREAEFKKPKVNSFLIVTEGTRTEPLYFKGMQTLIMNRIGGVIDVIAPTIDIHGKGCSTGRLIELTERLVKESKLMYQNIWVVFDKDDFDDFDRAIRDGESKGYQIAWSNQSFEYWLYLHFYYSDSALHRDDWRKKLDEIFKELGLGTGGYKKNDDMIYHIADSYGGVRTAINHAKRRMKNFDPSRSDPSKYDPGTTVHILVEQLKRYLDE